MENSILKSTKKMLGLADDYDAFDPDVIGHINGAFHTLTQLGLGPSDGYMIEDEEAVWDDFNTELRQKNGVKTYVYLKVRSLFDPPPTSFAIAALEKQIEELEWRLNVNRENQDWVDPDPEVIVSE